MDGGLVISNPFVCNIWFIIQLKQTIYTWMAIRDSGNSLGPRNSRGRIFPLKPLQARDLRIRMRQQHGWGMKTCAQLECACGLFFWGKFGLVDVWTKSHKQNRSKCWCRTSEIGDKSGDWIIERALLMPPKFKAETESGGDNFHRVTGPCVFSKDNFFVTKIQWVGRGILPFFSSGSPLELPKSWWQCLDLCFFLLRKLQCLIFFCGSSDKEISESI